MNCARIFGEILFHSYLDEAHAWVKVCVIFHCEEDLADFLDFIWAVFVGFLLLLFFFLFFFFKLQDVQNKCILKCVLLGGIQEVRSLSAVWWMVLRYVQTVWCMFLVMFLDLSMWIIVHSGVWKIRMSYILHLINLKLVTFYIYTVIR
jgi:hypothetical protein